MFNSENKNRFELVVQLKDSAGNCIGKKKSFIANTGEELEQIWIKENGIPRKSKKKRKPVEAATKYQLKEALDEVDSHIEKIRKSRKLEE